MSCAKSGGMSPARWLTPRSASFGGRSPSRNGARSGSTRTPAACAATSISGTADDVIVLRTPDVDFERRAVLFQPDGMALVRRAGF